MNADGRHDDGHAKISGGEGVYRREREGEGRRVTTGSTLKDAD